MNGRFELAEGDGEIEATLVSPVFTGNTLIESIADVPPEIAPMFQFAKVGDDVNLEVHDHETGEEYEIRLGVVVAAWTRP